MNRFEIYQENGEFYVYDRLQDIFIDRHLNAVSEGFLTRAEALAVIRLLKVIHA